jgi:hypothetical protein
MKKVIVFLVVLTCFVFAVNFSFALPCDEECTGDGYSWGTCVSNTNSGWFDDQMDKYPYCSSRTGPWQCIWGNYIVPGGDGTLCNNAECVCYNYEVCPTCTEYGTFTDVCSNTEGCILETEDTQAPVVTITSPTSSSNYVTDVDRIILGGSVSDNEFLYQVRWINNRLEDSGSSNFLKFGISEKIDFAGETSGSWTACDGFVDSRCVMLEPGSNVITVFGEDGSGNVGVDTLMVTYSPPAEGSEPTVSIQERTNDYRVTVNDPQSDSVDVSLSWGGKVKVYFLPGFASDDGLSLTNSEKNLYSEWIRGVADEWDRLTLGKHPVDFYFIEPFALDTYSSSQSHFDYLNAIEDEFESKYSGYWSEDDYRIYVLPYPEPYYTEVPAFVAHGLDEDNFFGFIYFSPFDNPEMNSYEEITDTLIHEMVHAFTVGGYGEPSELVLPSGINGNNQFFWNGHPAGFHDGYADSRFPESESPTGTEGYYELYSPISYGRTDVKAENLGDGVATTLSAYDEMCMGIRSRYDDGDYLFYETNTHYSGSNRIVDVLDIHDYDLSSSWLFKFSEEAIHRNDFYWDIRYHSDVVSIGTGLSVPYTFTVDKADQENRSLRIYVDDSSHPGHFEAFSNNAQSEVVVVDDESPSAPTNLNGVVDGSGVSLTWDESSDNIGIDNYVVERNGVAIASVVENSYFDSGAFSVSSYRVIAVDFAGNSAESEIFSADSGCSFEAISDLLAAWSRGEASMDDLVDAVTSWMNC